MTIKKARTPTPAERQGMPGFLKERKTPLKDIDKFLIDDFADGQFTIGDWMKR
jgi:hypothetical protein